MVGTSFCWTRERGWLNRGYQMKHRVSHTSIRPAIVLSKILIRRFTRCLSMRNGSHRSNIYLSHNSTKFAWFILWPAIVSLSPGCCLSVTPSRLRKGAMLNANADEQTPEIISVVSFMIIHTGIKPQLSISDSLQTSVILLSNWALV